MLFLKPLAFAASAAALVIPEISEEEESLFRALPVDVESNPLPAYLFAQTVTVPCTQCQDPESKLTLNFAIEDNARLTLNGFELYPNVNPWGGDLVAAVVKPDGTEEEQNLGFGVAVQQHPEDDGTPARFIGVDLRIIEVGNRFVDEIPTVNILLVDVVPPTEMAIGLTIYDVKVAEDKSKDGNKASCDSIWCLAKDKFHEAVKKIKSGAKGCGGMRGHGHKGGNKHHGKPGPKGYGKGPHHNGGHGKGGHGKGGHHHHGGAKYHHDGFQHHSLGSSVKNFVSYILLPLIMGITAGIGIAVVSMFAGRLALRLFNHLWAGRCQAPVSSPHKAVLETVVEEDEKSGLIADQEPPPQYEEDHSGK